MTDTCRRTDDGWIDATGEPCSTGQRHCPACPAHAVHHLAHEQGTCPTCVGKARGHLQALEDLAAAMPREAEVRGVRSEAAYLAGPVADAEQLMHVRNSHDYGRRPGPAPEEDPHHPLAVLGRWVLFVAEDYAEDTDTLAATVAAQAGWLRARLPRIAHDITRGGQPVHDFDGFLRELGASRRHMESVLRDGEQVDRGSTCPMCGDANLVKRWGWNEAADRWVCPRGECRASYEEDDYRHKVEATYVRHAPALTASQIADVYGVPAGSVRGWCSQGKVRKRGRDQSGRVLYDVADTLRVRAEPARASA